MMNGGASPDSLVQQIMGRIPNWWSMDNLKPVSQEISAFSFLSPSSSPSLSSSSPSSSSYNSSPSSSSLLSHYPKKILANLCPMTPWHDNQELPESRSQLLLGGVLEEEDASSFAPYPSRKIDNWDDHQMTYSSSNNYVLDIKQEASSGKIGYAYYNNYGNQPQESQPSRSSWSQATAIPASYSPRSCITTSYTSNNMLDFSNCKIQRKHQQLDHFSECNSPSATAIKKPKLQASTTAQSPLKVRKEKLGDRITALHQIVSPFGKTDTASVLLEAIGYIRFLHSQIEALSSPYLGSGSRKMRHKLMNENSMKKIGPPHDQDAEATKDLRSKGLCLVPVSLTMHVGSDHNGADFWAPNYGAAGF